MDGRGSELDLIWRSAAVNNNKSKSSFMRLGKDHTTQQMIHRNPKRCYTGIREHDGEPWP